MRVSQRQMGALVLMALTASCAHQQGTKPLTATDFITRQQTADTHRPLDRSGERMYNDVGVDLINPPEGETPGTPVRALSETVNQGVQAPSPTSLPATNPATVTPGVSSGQYMTVGAVVSRVNGTAIYANEVLKALRAPLAAKARDLDAKQFEAVASDLIDRQVREFVRAELEFAASQRNLEADDRKLAERLTAQWRQRQVTDAGGSLENARRRAAADGSNFDELVQQQFRLFMTRIFYEKKVIPKIQVSADDMRNYYDRNPNEFTDRARTRFRLIRVGVGESGGREQALAKAKSLYEKAKANQDFTELARTNDDAGLIRTAGDVGWVDKGAWADDKVERAVWDAPVGGVSEIVDTGKAFWIAKVEERQGGNVRPFDDEKVQDGIRGKLRSQQFAKLREEVQENLIQGAIIQPDLRDAQAASEAEKPAVEMAMQLYPAWAGAPATQPSVPPANR